MPCVRLLLALLGPVAVGVEAAVPGVVACVAGAIMRRRSSSNNSSVDACERAFGVGRAH
jgi:hypothetical protein